MDTKKLLESVAARIQQWSGESLELEARLNDIIFALAQDEDLHRDFDALVARERNEFIAAMKEAAGE